MNLRNYNIYFNTHTISGIIITAVLYVIFFAGSFSFFKNEITNWQYNRSAAGIASSTVDFNRLADSIDQKYQLYSRDVTFSINPHGHQLWLSLSAPKDTTLPKAGVEKKRGRGLFLLLDAHSASTKDYKENYNLGEFLYRLHFLAPLNGVVRLGFPVGYYIAGGVAFIFLFALITGVLVHWQKIVSNFYVFRPWEKLKTLWTDLHTALGVISFPYMFVFAVTGAYFLISYPLFIQPAIKVQYQGDQDAYYKEMGYSDTEYEFQYKKKAGAIDINHFIEDADRRWESAVIRSVSIKNYGDAGMHVIVRGQAPEDRQMSSTGELVYNADGQVIEQQDPFAPTGYSDQVSTFLYDLHFGNYGGYFTKILYFLLGISGCVVIISGVMIWLTARDKKHIPEKKRKFNAWLANIYLSVCLSMYPVTAAAFIAVKIYPNGGQHFVYSFYFWLWLALSLVLILRRNNYRTNRDCLLAGSILGLAVPIVNGIVTGQWLWDNFRMGYHDLMFVDVFWLFTGCATLICWRLVIRKHKKATAVTK